jgi:hypothetical protein
MFLILSYCNTIKKKNLLSNLIDTLKEKFPDREVILYSHYGDLESSYYSKSDYYIYDRSNPDLNTSINVWRYVPELNKTINKVGIDRGYSVFNMIKKGSMFAKSIGASELTVMNYDFSRSDVRDDIMDLNKEIEAGQVAVFNKWGDDNSVSLILFHLRLNLIGYDFFESINENSYRSRSHCISGEYVMYSMFNEKFEGRFSIADKKISPQIDSWSNAIPQDHMLKRYFECVALTTQENSSREEKYISLYITNVKIENILVKIGENVYQIKNSIEGENSNRAFFSRLPENEFSEISILGVNGENMETYLMDEIDENFWINSYHQ